MQKSRQIHCENTSCPARDLLTYSMTLKHEIHFISGNCREFVWEASSSASFLRFLLNLLDPEGEHLQFSTHYRLIGAPQPHSPPPLPPSQLNGNLLVTKPKHSLLGEQNRGWWEGGWRLKVFLVEEKLTCEFLCVVARWCSNRCSLNIYVWP